MHGYSSLCRGVRFVKREPLSALRSCLGWSYILRLLFPSLRGVKRRRRPVFCVVVICLVNAELLPETHDPRCAGSKRGGEREMKANGGDYYQALLCHHRYEFASR